MWRKEGDVACSGVEICGSSGAWDWGQHAQTVFEYPLGGLAHHHCCHLDRGNGGGSLLDAAYRGAQGRNQLVHRERAGDVVVGPEVDGLDLVLAVLTRRQHHYRDPLSRFADVAAALRGSLAGVSCALIASAPNLAARAKFGRRS